MTADDDLALARRCAAGDEDAWAVFVARYRAFMIGFARRIVHETAAVDLTDAVIADLWQRGKMARFEGRSSLRTWLGALMANGAMNVRRSAPRAAEPERRTGSRAAPRDESEPADREASALVSRALTESIAALPDEDRVLILMHYEQDLSLSQCAAVLCASKSTLSRRLAAVRERIRQDAEHMTRERHGASLEQLRAGGESALLDLDLRAACALAGNAGARRVSKE